MKSSKLLAFFTALVLLFSLCACSTNAPSGNSNKDKLDGVAVALKKGQQFSTDAATSIDVLREEIGKSAAQFGIAYIGYFDAAAAEDTGIDFAQWFEASSSGVAAYYPFVTEIDKAHIQLVSKGIQLQLIVHGDLTQFGNVKGSKSSTAAH